MSKLSRILTVEDEALLLLALIDNLADHGLEAVPVTSARAAISLIDTNIDALITDIELPGSYDGLQLARLASRLRPGLPIVVASGGVRPTAAELPPNAVFIPKPYSIEHVIAALEQQLTANAA